MGGSWGGSGFWWSLWGAFDNDSSPRSQCARVLPLLPGGQRLLLVCPQSQGCEDRAGHSGGLLVACAAPTSCPMCPQERDPKMMVFAELPAAGLRVAAVLGHMEGETPVRDVWGVGVRGGAPDSLRARAGALPGPPQACFPSPCRGPGPGSQDLRGRAMATTWRACSSQAFRPRPGCPLDSRLPGEPLLCPQAPQVTQRPLGAPALPALRLLSLVLSGPWVPSGRTQLPTRPCTHQSPVTASSWEGGPGPHPSPRGRGHHRPADLPLVTPHPSTPRGPSCCPATSWSPRLWLVRVCVQRLPDAGTW